MQSNRAQPAWFGEIKGPSSKENLKGIENRMRNVIALENLDMK